MNPRAYFVLAVSFILLTACSYDRPLMITPQTLGPKEKPLAIAHGEASESWFLGFHAGGENSFFSAIEDAKQKAGVTNATLYNVFVDREIYCFPACWLPLYTEVTTSVFGTLVTYDEPGFLKPKTRETPRSYKEPGMM